MLVGNEAFVPPSVVGQPAVQSIGPGLEADAYVRPLRESLLGAEAGCQHTKFALRILRGAEGRPIAAGDLSGSRAVDGDEVGACAFAADRIRDDRPVVRVLVQHIGARLDHTRSQGYQVKGDPLLDRKLHHPLCVDRLPQRGAGRVQQGRLRLDIHCFRGAPEFELRVYRHGPIDADFDRAPLESLEALVFRTQGIGSRLKVGEGIVALGICIRREANVGGCVGQSHVRGRNGSAARVQYTTRQGAPVLLPEQPFLKQEKGEVKWTPLSRPFFARNKLISGGV